MALISSFSSFFKDFSRSPNVVLCILLYDKKIKFLASNIFLSLILDFVLVGAAKNAAIRQSNGKYICFFDSVSKDICLRLSK